MAERDSIQEDFFTQFARMGKAVSSPARLQILFLLQQGEKSVEHLARLANLSVANASQHLQQLKTVRLVTSRKDGQRVNYSIASLAVNRFWGCLSAFSQGQLLEVQQLAELHRSQWGHIPQTTESELKTRLGKKGLLVVDVRPAEEYHSGHLEGAISLPLSELTRRMKEIPAGSELVVYCRGTFSKVAFEAATLLAKAGFQPKVLPDGFPGMAAAGLPIQSDVPLAS